MSLLIDYPKAKRRGIYALAFRAIRIPQFKGSQVGLQMLPRF